MTVWDSAESTILTAAAKVYAALKISHPSGKYGTGIWVTLNIDGTDYQCRCDCTGVVQAIIRVMGYDPNWGASSISGHTGDGWYLTDATSSFVKNSSGDISPDWEVVDFNPSDVRPGDIRAHGEKSHCDIFVAYKDDVAYGLNAGSTEGIQASSNAGTQYLEDNNEDDLAATRTIQDDKAAKVLRFVKGKGSSSMGNVNNTQASGIQSLRSLDIELGFIEPVTFEYMIKDETSKFQKVIPGFFPNNAYYPDNRPNNANADGSYGDSWIEFVASYTLHWDTSSTDWASVASAGLVMLYTLDNSDPLTNGRTIFLNKDGSNDYAKSNKKVPIIRTRFPVHFRCVLVDSAAHSQEYGRSSAFLTNQSSEDSNASVADLVKAARNSTFLADAAGKSPECDDAHGYLFLHDEDDSYTKGEYSTWVRGIEED